MGRKIYTIFFKNTWKKLTSILGLNKSVLLKRNLNRPGMRVLVSYPVSRCFKGGNEFCGSKNALLNG
jgi:hypothetical protein